MVSALRFWFEVQSRLAPIHVSQWMGNNDQQSSSSPSQPPSSWLTPPSSSSSSPTSLCSSSCYVNYQREAHFPTLPRYKLIGQLARPSKVPRSSVNSVGQKLKCTHLSWSEINKNRSAFYIRMLTVIRLKLWHSFNEDTHTPAVWLKAATERWFSHANTFVSMRSSWRSSPPLKGCGARKVDVFCEPRGLTHSLARSLALDAFFFSFDSGCRSHTPHHSNSSLLLMPIHPLFCNLSVYCRLEVAAQLRAGFWF